MSLTIVIFSTFFSIIIGSTGSPWVGIHGGRDSGPVGPSEDGPVMNSKPTPYVSDWEHATPQ